MLARKIGASLYKRLSSWEIVTEELPAKAVVIGAPHTSYWDGIFMAVAFWNYGRNMKFLVKSQAMRGPLRAIIKWAGGVGVDRQSKHGLVTDIVEQSKNSDDFLLVIAPKGTRSRREYWKSGFYHIAYQADLPVVLGYIDSENHRFGWAHSIKLTGNMKADMDVIRAFYADKKGKRPQYDSIPRLRGEAEPA